MNYLAHVFLSGPDVETVVGNFIGDGVKGKIPTDLSPAMQRGVRLHRFIDSYADDHPINEEMKKLIRPAFRKYAGVVLDMYHDHFLASNWPDYAQVELADYIDGHFDSFEPYLHFFPEKTHRLFTGMKEGDWMLNYQHLEGMDRAFRGMAKRTKFVSNMEKGVEVLEENYKELEDGFKRFFPEIITHSARFRQELLRTV